MLFGSSGIRRKYDRALVELAVSVGSAVARQARHVVVGRDTRTTGPVLAGGFIAGVLGAGGEVRYGGIAPTPTVAYAVRQAEAGCMITASHNPEPYNGLKLLNPDGSSFTLRQQAATEDLVGEPFWTGWEQQGSAEPADLVPGHIEGICASVAPGEDLRMVVDCGNGAGSVITPRLLAGAGIRTDCLNCNTAGRFARPSEPLETNLPYIGAMVRSTGADGAIIHDGDADRFMAFDGRGRYISGDHLLILFATWLGARRVVTTVDASMAIEEVAEVARTPVGDSFVSEKLISWGDFGGEPSGSWIFPGFSLCPDGIYAAALFCRICSEWDVAEVIDGLPRYPILRSSYPCDTPGAVLTRLGATHPTDGIRFEDEDGWCLIRASGTEPKVRITAEGRTQEAAKAMEDRGRRMLADALID
ncbi:MAG: phosphopentomutase/phosphoglucosamine mutase [Methanomicrobiales archaeon]|nr:phosphopentomutase/phosphoglucosamine mutase [Methanomicrobiales archaeon]